MTVVVAMAGFGSRFERAGFQVAKYRIRARGRTLFEWSIRSLSSFFDDLFVFACLESHDTEWIRDTALGLGIRRVAFHTRREVSKGQAETVHDAISAIDTPGHLWIYNVDTYVARGLAPQQISGAAGCVPVFASTSQNMSFVQFDEASDVIRIAEKEPISNWATVGLYGFANAAEFRRLYREAYIEGRLRLAAREMYVAPIYELMLAEGKRVVAPKLRPEDVHILGTPAELCTFDPKARPPYGS